MLASNKKIIFISAEQTLDLRSRVLRPGQSIENCKYLEDDDITTFHVGVVENNRVICNGTFIQQEHQLFSTTQNPFRLRGMATDPLYQRQGLGRLVIESALHELKNRNADFLWFNARTSAEIFYQKLGFLTIEDIFEIPTVGPHKVMYKWLK